jgi:hypothetical protein
MEIQKKKKKMTLLQQKRQSEENPSFLDVINQFGHITEREIDENVIRSVPKNTEKQEQCLETVYVIYFYSRNILPKYHLFLKINRIISIQVCY